MYGNELNKTVAVPEPSQISLPFDIVEYDDKKFQLHGNSTVTASQATLNIDIENFGSVTIPEYIIIDKTEYIDPVTIYYGSYGAIIKYKSVDNSNSIIIKCCPDPGTLGSWNNSERTGTEKNETTEANEADETTRGKSQSENNLTYDIKIINILQQSIYKKIIVPSVIHNNIIIMDHMTGDCMKLLDICAKLKENDTLHGTDYENMFILNVLRELVKYFMYLLKIKLYYTDIKLENFLFKSIGKSIIKLYLGDLGGITEEDKDMTVTYVPYEKRNSKTYGYPSEKHIVWGIGVLILQFLSINIYDALDVMYEPENLENRIRALIQEVTVSFDTYTDIIKGCLDIDPVERWDIARCYEWLDRTYQHFFQELIADENDYRMCMFT
jgi:serine/threonine protein kinase